MVIILADGRMCNQLMVTAHVLASALEHGFSVWNPGFAPYAAAFPATATTRFEGIAVRLDVHSALILERFAKAAKRTKRVPRSLSRQLLVEFSGDAEFDLCAAPFLAAARTRVVLARGRNFKAFPLVTRHQNALRRYFAPSMKVWEAAGALVARTRLLGDSVVGVHIRRTDYRDWEDGRYLFSPAVYQQRMKEIQGLLAAQGRSAAFLLVSDEPINLDDYFGLQAIAGTADPVGDLYALSRCDYIIGPPSTFSMWASFYGQVPLCWLSSNLSESLTLLAPTSEILGGRPAPDARLTRR